MKKVVADLGIGIVEEGSTRVRDLFLAACGAGFLAACGDSSAASSQTTRADPPAHAKPAVTSPAMNEGAPVDKHGAEAASAHAAAQHPSSAKPATADVVTPKPSLPASPAPAPAEKPAAPKKLLITLPELAGRRDLWPERVRLTKRVGFSPTEIYEPGLELPLVEIVQQDLHVETPDGIIAVPATSTDVLERASDLIATLSPEQLAVTAQSLPNRPELWPVEVTVTRPLGFSGGASIPAGRKVHLRRFEGGELNVYDREIKNWFNAAVNETDVLARARERVKLPESERTSFFARSVGAALESSSGEGALAKADYVLVYQAKLGCGRCAAFLPTLDAFYARMKAAHPEFEAVFVSADTSAENAKKLAASEKLPGRAVAYERRLEAAELGTLTQGGELLPLVFLYDKAGKLVSRNQPQGGKPSEEDVLALLEQKLELKR